MQSKKSCFNKAVFLNTLKRFWPLWFVYLAVWMLAGPIATSATYISNLHSLQRDILDLANTGGLIIGMAGGVLSAMAVWSFMYNSKTMSGIACLPVKREGVFLSATLAGLLPAVVINVLVFALCAVFHALRGYSGAVVFDIQAFAIVTMLYIFFYGFATLCAQLTGNIITLPVVFLVLNFVATVVEAVASSLMEVIVYGLGNRGFGISMYLSPPVGILNGGPRSNTVYIESTGNHEVQSIYYEGWGFIVICCIVGILMLLGALALYRRRKMESVGDIVAIDVLKPVFKYCMTFGGAICSGAFFWAILINYFWLSPLVDTLWIIFFMLVGAFIGYFAAEMLIRKSFRVFRGKWKGFAVSCAIICVVMLGLELNLLGIETRVPDAEQVESVEVFGSDHIIYDEPENISAAIALHRSVIENKDIHERDTGLGSSFHIYYTLKNGNSFSRIYYIRYGETLEDVEALENLQNSAEAIEKRKSLPFVPNEENFVSGQLQGSVTAEELAELNPGYSEEDLIIMNYYGYNEEYVLKQMSPAEKQQLMEEYELYGKGSYVKAFRHTWNFSAEEMWELYSQCIVPDLAEGKVGKLWIVEDEEYLNNVYSARISIDLAYKDSEIINYALSEELGSVTSPRPIAIENVSGRKYTTFYTVPTVGSRTEAWLLDHGVILHTVAEERAMTGGNSQDW